jgi:hypothetical protein
MHTTTGRSNRPGRHIHTSAVITPDIATRLRANIIRTPHVIRIPQWNHPVRGITTLTAVCRTSTTTASSASFSR